MNGVFQVFDVNRIQPGSNSPVLLTQILEIGVPLTSISNSSSYTLRINSADLISGGVSVSHNLNRFIKSSLVWLNDQETITPDRVTNIDLNTVFIDLTSFSHPTNSFIIIVT